MASLNAIFILAICVAGFLLVCCIAAPVLIWATRRKQNSRRWIGGGLLVLATLYMALLWSYHSWATRPSAVFEMAFGFPPPTDVTIHRSDHYILGDLGEQSLAFSAAPTTIDRILKHRFATSLAESTASANGEYRFSCEFSESFAVETEELIYDPNSRAAYYYWTGID